MVEIHNWTLHMWPMEFISTRQIELREGLSFLSTLKIYKHFLKIYKHFFLTLQNRHMGDNASAQPEVKAMR